MDHAVGVVCSIGVPAARGGREVNEDNYLVCRGGRVEWREGRDEHVERATGPGTLLAVADGMGGHQQGEVAATAAVRVLSKLYQEARPQDPARALRRYVQEAHRRLHERARAGGEVKMGTTLTVAWLLDTSVAWVQVGDSRLYLFREGRLRQVTADHTRGEFARRDGRSAALAEHLAQSFIFGSRGLGDDANLRLEDGRDAGLLEVRRGDRLLLCTDGLWGSVDDASLADVLQHTVDPQAAAVAAMERAMARGSTDNITVIVVG